MNQARLLKQQQIAVLQLVGAKEVHFRDKTTLPRYIPRGWPDRP
jgi:hypothetical protein